MQWRNLRAFRSSEICPISGTWIANLESQHDEMNIPSALVGLCPLTTLILNVIQADYVLGNNPIKMSYLVGYGDKYPQYVHHRGASIPADATTGCSDGFKWLNATDPNPNVATGGLVGGPFLNETYIDSRNNSMQGEPSTYNSALIVGLLSGLVTTSSVVQSFT